MYKNKETLRFFYKTYISSNKYVLPLVVLCMFFGFSYSIKPLGVLESYTLSMVGIFFIMVWCGWGYNESESPVMEQVLIFKIGKESRYYALKLLFFLGLSTAFAGLAVFIPVLLNIISGFVMFNRSLLLSDVVIAFGLHIFVAYAGCITGAVLHPRILKNRTVAALVLVLYTMMGILKKSLIGDIPIFQYIAWIFPPVSEFMDLFVNEVYYTVNAVSMTFFSFGIYSLILSGIYISGLIKNKF